MPAPVLVYCTIAQLHTFGLNADALSEFTDAEKLAACEAASRQMDTYFVDRFKLPFTTTGTDLAMQCAPIATMILLSSRGYQPQDPGQDVPRLRYEDAIAWLKLVANGTATPVVTDSSSSPTGVASFRPRVTSNESRGFEGISGAFTGKRR